MWWIIFAFLSGALWMVLTLWWLSARDQRLNYPYTYICPSDECDFKVSGDSIIGVDQFATDHERTFHAGD